MGYLRRVDRSAAVGFCPVGPYLAAGSAANAIDMNFTASSVFEIFRIDFASSDVEMEPAGAPVPASERFHRVSWGTTGIDTKAHSLGLVAGGLEDGTVQIWDPSKAIGPQADPQRATITKLKKHSSAVRGLEFSRISPNLFASGSSEAELMIWDLTRPAVPSFSPAMKGSPAPGNGAAEITYLAWNVKVQHILAACTSSGQTNVFDLRRQKPIAILRDLNSQRRCSVFQWNPDVATQVVVASEDDRSPSLQLWDLRNSVSPAKEFLGHTKGVLGMSWCPHDSRLLLSCAKDGSTFCWDVPTGEVIGELPGTGDWNLDVQWSPTTPGLFSIASFNGTVGVCSLQSFVAPQSGADAYGAHTGSATTLKLAPVWMRRPCGVSFGFGGKLASFCHPEQQVTDPTTRQNVRIQKDQISLKQIVTEQESVSQSEAFDEAVSSRENSKLQEFCQTRSTSTAGDEQEMWKFLGMLFSADPQRDLLSHLGFEDVLPVNEATADVQKGESAGTDQPTTTGHAVVDGSDFFVDDGTDFFNRIAEDKTLGAQVEPAQPRSSPKAEDAAPSPAAPRSRGVSRAGEREDEIQRALIVGNYEAAVEACMKAERTADALIISHAGGAALHKKTVKRYMDGNPRPFMALISAAIDNDFEGLINQRLVSQWRETLALVISYVHDQESWSSLSEALASRLAKAGMQHPATLCYIISGNVDRAVSAWTKNKKMTIETMQNIIEKAIILGLGANKREASPVLCELVHNYALILASQGSMRMAIDYLNMIPGDASESVSYLLKRIYDSGAVDVQAADGTAGIAGQQDMMAQPAQMPQPAYQDRGMYAQASSTMYSYDQPMQTSSTAPAQPGYYTQQYSQRPEQYNQYSPYPGSQQAAQPSYGHQQPGLVVPGPQQGVSLMPGGQSRAPLSPTHTTSAPSFEPVSTTPHQQPSLMTPPYQQALPSHSMQQPASPAKPPSPPAPPPGPPADISVATADTSQVPQEQRVIVAVLTTLFQHCEVAAQNPGRRREMADSSKRLGMLFWKMNKRELSAAMVQSLLDLVRALEAGDMASALNIQLRMTDTQNLWEEGEAWLPALKRLLRTRQMLR